jgi:5'-methylthioadenosine phosphorylase
MEAGIAVIGGSGLYRMEGSRVLQELDIPTPFGMPSDLVSIVDIAGTPVAFLPRHGKGHRHLPTEVPSRANIWALKSLGVRQIISVSAVGSLSESYRPGDFVLCDQLIDRTFSRAASYFGDGIVGHVSFADPFCPSLRAAFAEALRSTGHRCHPAGTLVCMEGPLFSTRAESELYRSWGAHCVGMTALPEAKLAREAEICYAVIAMVTD